VLLLVLEGVGAFRAWGETGLSENGLKARLLHDMARAEKQPG
jgi:hypothetical protein